MQGAIRMTLTCTPTTVMLAETHAAIWFLCCGVNCCHSLQIYAIMLLPVIGSCFQNAVVALGQVTHPNGTVINVPSRLLWVSTPWILVQGLEQVYSATYPG
jgi:hypothetical protein